jgi:N-methylhydantoinase B
MPRGRFAFSDYIEDDVASDIPIRLKVAATIGDGEIHLDFTGSDVQVASALNVPTGGQSHPFMAGALINYFVTRDPSIPLNAGVLRPLRMTLPEGSVVNPQFPAACGVRYATVVRIYDTLLGALAQAVPDDIPAASAGQGCMVALALPDPEAGRRHVTVLEPMLGGGGGRPGQDGIDGCDASLGFLRTTPAESLEVEVPIVVRRFHLVPESAGAGRFRGGFGVRLDVQVFRPEGVVTARGMERLRFQPWGLAGGSAGANGRVVLNPGTPSERAVPKIDVLSLEPGDVLSVRTPGGGGWGDPLERPPALVADELAAGLIGESQARERYGVVLDGGGIDEPATAALRAARRAAGQPVDGRMRVDFGAARREHERTWTPEVYDALIGVLMGLPIPYRAYVRRILYGRIQALAATRPVGPADVDRLWEELAASARLGQATRPSH